MANGDNPPYGFIADAFRAGEVVPFLGAGASAVYRPNDDGGWTEGKSYLPFGFELAKERLAPAASFPDPDLEANLALVASYVEHVASDRRALNQALHDIFSREYRPGTIHQLLAQIPQPLLIVTTNYDDLMEQAFGDRSFYLVVDCGDKSRVWVAPGGGFEPIKTSGFEPIKTSDLREALQPGDRPDLPIIYKLHGSFVRNEPEGDRFVITEQDYVDFLGRAKTCVPPYLATRMAKSRFLFLGYSLLDWNVRVLLRKLRPPARGQENQLRSWAINKNPGAAERKIWEAHRVNIYDLDIKMFVDQLAHALGIAINEHSG